MGSGKWRLRRPKDAAASFMENRTQMGDVVTYDAGRDLWIDRQNSNDIDDRVLAIWHEGNEEVEKLFQALEKYVSKDEKEKRGSGVGVSVATMKIDVRHMKWDEVFGQISAAADQYESEGARGPKGVVKRTLRGISAHAPAMKQWMNLIPSGDYGACIAGAFQMFASAAQRSYEMRKSVRDVMTEIPRLLNRNRDYIDLYKARPRDALTKAVADLFKAILVTLRLVVEYLTHSSSGRAFKALFKGEDFERDLEESIEEVRRLADQTSEEAAVSHQDRTRRIEELLNQVVGAPQVADTLYGLLTSNPNYSVKTGERRHLGPPRIEVVISSASESDTRSTRKSPPPGPSRKKVLRALDFDIDSPASDIRECQNFQHTLDVHAKDEATYVIQSKKVKRWLTKTDKSRALLVNGNRPDSAMEDMSAVSVVSAELISLFSLSKSAIVVSYFCGLHADMEDEPSEWVAEMMKSLICQLLAQPKDRHLKFDLSFIKEDDIERMQDNDLDKLCRIFKKIVQQLPSDKILFCILDSISRFEAAAEAETDVIEALRQIMDVLASRRKKITMKLLLTSPSDSSIVGDEDMEKEVTIGDVLVVPDSVDGVLQGVVNTDGVEDSVHLS